MEEMNIVELARQKIEEKREKRLTELTEKWRKLIQDALNVALEEVKYWHGYYIPRDTCLKMFNNDDERAVLKAAKNFGICIRDDGFVTIPDLQEGEKQTAAQELLIEFNQQLKKRIKEERTRAQQAVSIVLARINEGEFEDKQDKENNYAYCIFVEQQNKNLTAAFKEKVEQLMKAKGFLKVSIGDKGWLIYIPKAENK